MTTQDSPSTHTENSDQNTVAESSASANKPPKPRKIGKIARINRLGIGFVIMLQILLALASVVLLNYLTAPHHIRKDLTESSTFTVSEYTDAFLKSDLIQKHDGEIKIIALLKRNSPHKQRVRGILEEYSRRAPGIIDIEIVDYIKEANRFNELSSIYGKNFYEETILIDARTDAEREKSSQTMSDSTQPKGTPAPLVGQAGQDQPINPLLKIRQFPLQLLYKTSEDGKRISGWEDEKHITSYLLSAVEGISRKFYLITDKSQVDEVGSGTPAWSAFQQHLDSQNIQLEAFQISSGKPLPADAEGLAIIGLDSDFDRNEIKILQEYWDRNSSAIFITINPDAKLTNIRRFMKSYGIAVEKDRVITTSNGRMLTKARGNFVKGSDITKGFGNKATQLDGPSRSISIVDVNTLSSKNISVFSVLHASPGWWGEVNYNQPNPKFTPGKDHGTAPNAVIHRPLVLSAAVVRGREDLDRTKHLTSKMIVIGNTQFLKPSNTRSELTHFINSSINWLAGREKLVGTIGSKPVYQQKLTIKKDDKDQIDLIVILIIPSIGLAITLLVWFNRKS